VNRRWPSTASSIDPCLHWRRSIPFEKERYLIKHKLQLSEPERVSNCNSCIVRRLVIVPPIKNINRGTGRRKFIFNLMLHSTHPSTGQTCAYNAQSRRFQRPLLSLTTCARALLPNKSHLAPFQRRTFFNLLVILSTYFYLPVRALQEAV